MLLTTSHNIHYFNSIAQPWGVLRSKLSSLHELPRDKGTAVAGSFGALCGRSCGAAKEKNRTEQSLSAFFMPW